MFRGSEWWENKDGKEQGRRKRIDVGSVHTDIFVLCTVPAEVRQR